MALPFTQYVHISQTNAWLKEEEVAAGKPRRTILLLFEPAMKMFNEPHFPMFHPAHSSI